jgi:hypothetical protein
VVRVRMPRWCEYEVVEGPPRQCDKQLLIQGLAEAGRPAVPPLIEAFGDGDRDVRSAACEALVMIGKAGGAGVDRKVGG